MIRDGESGDVEFLLWPADNHTTLPFAVIVQPTYPREQMFDLELPR